MSLLTLVIWLLLNILKQQTLMRQISQIQLNKTVQQESCFNSFHKMGTNYINLLKIPQTFGSGHYVCLGKQGYRTTPLPQDLS